MFSSLLHYGMGNILFRSVGGQTEEKTRPYPIPSQAIERMIDKWEVPQPWEAHEVDYVI